LGGCEEGRGMGKGGRSSLCKGSRIEEGGGLGGGETDRGGERKGQSLFIGEKR
jgi:hypothetical protein